MSIKQRALASLSLSPAAMSQHHTQPTRSAIRTVPGVRGVVALMATVWIAFPMSAYAQTISAKPAEVVFYTKSATTQKSTTISWNGEDASSPEVYYRINGGGEIKWASGDTGRKAADFISLDNSYEFCLWAKGHVTKLDCVDVTTKYVKPNLNLGFIRNVDEVPHGNSVTISFTTDRTATAAVLISDKAPKPFLPISKEDVGGFAPEDVVSASLPSFNTTNHSFDLSKLEPDKKFFYIISAYDKQNDVWFKLSGKFRTLQRKVTVKFDNVKVVDDSDDLSPGDLVFGFFINGQNAPNGKPMTFGTHASTDAKKSINMKGSITGAPGTLKLKAVGYDDDETEWVPVGPFVVVLLGTCGTGDVTNPNTTEGENDCGEWTSGSQSFDLKALGQNAADPEDFTHPFTIKARPKGDDSEVSFDFSGTIRVRYVP